MGRKIRWRRLHSRLWAGRDDDHPVGTIEHGRGFVFVDLQGERHEGYPTLEDAKNAATGPIPLPTAPRRGPTPFRGARIAGAVAVVVAVLVLEWIVLRYGVFV